MTQFITLSNVGVGLINLNVATIGCYFQHQLPEPRGAKSTVRLTDGRDLQVCESTDEIDRAIRNVGKAAVLSVS